MTIILDYGSERGIDAMALPLQNLNEKAISVNEESRQAIFLIVQPGFFQDGLQISLTESILEIGTVYHMLQAHWDAILVNLIPLGVLGFASGEHSLATSHIKVQGWVYVSTIDLVAPLGHNGGHMSDSIH
ncbi:hypothetical protein JCM17960_14470 [Magnetospira thiophila]